MNKEKPLINYTEALEVVLSSINVLSDEKVGLVNSLGRILAQDIVSNLDIPPFDNSAMDGYAVRSEDGTWEFSVVEDVPAGYIASKELSQGEAIRIMTGAPIPKGADSVVMVEDTATFGGNPKSKIQNPKLVKILKSVKPGANIRRAGEDIKKGDLVIGKGTIIKPAHIGMLAALGISKIRAARKPKIAILATGDEVVEITEELKPGKIRNANGYSLYSQAQSCGTEPISLGIAKDEEEEIRRKILEGLHADILIISGGVSVGDYDLVSKILTDLSMEIKFHKVAIRPGKPVLFGLLWDKPVFGLPGNPVSSMVVFELFVRPAVLKMLGTHDNPPKKVEAVLDEDIKKKAGLRYFLRAHTEWKGGAYVTRTTGPQGSGILKSMVIANSLIELPEELEGVEKGFKVNVRFLE